MCCPHDVIVRGEAITPFNSNPTFRSALFLRSSVHYRTDRRFETDGIFDVHQPGEACGGTHVKRASVQQPMNFKERLAAESRRFKEAAEKERPGTMARELLLRRARQADTALRINDWLTSPERASPK